MTDYPNGHNEARAGIHSRRSICRRISRVRGTARNPRTGTCKLLRRFSQAEHRGRAKNRHRLRFRRYAQPACPFLGRPSCSQAHISNVRATGRCARFRSGVRLSYGMSLRHRRSDFPTSHPSLAPSKAACKRVCGRNRRRPCGNGSRNRRRSVRIQNAFGQRPRLPSSGLVCRRLRRMPDHLHPTVSRIVGKRSWLFGARQPKPST